MSESLIQFSQQFVKNVYSFSNVISDKNHLIIKIKLNEWVVEQMICSNTSNHSGTKKFTFLV